MFMNNAHLIGTKSWKLLNLVEVTRLDMRTIVTRSSGPEVKHSREKPEVLCSTPGFGIVDMRW